MMGGRWLRATLGVMAVALLGASCRPAGPAPGRAPVPEPLPTREPILRVGIAVDSPTVTVGAETAYAIDPAGDPVAVAAGEEWTFSADTAGRLTAQGPAGRTLGPFAEPVRIVPEPGRAVRIAGRPYRGTALLLSRSPGRVTAVNVVELEEYLLGVVPREIGRRPPEEIEAVKAQAVAARTYAVGHLGHRERFGFDVFATVSDQVYGGLADEDPVVSEAVRATRGEIVAYGGEPILAYYHSTAGGHTAALHEVWPWTDERFPYLQPVSEKIPGTDDQYYDQRSNRFRWSVSWTGPQLRDILGKTLADHYGAPRGVTRVETIEVTGRTPSGRAEAVRIVADGREYRVPGDSIRWILRPEPGRILNSSMLLDVVAERDGGEITALRVDGGGWGHGIGMCQWGAMGRARAGSSYREILTTYYRDTEVLRLY